jgi:hypothetical protein
MRIASFLRNNAIFCAVFALSVGCGQVENDPGEPSGNPPPPPSGHPQTAKSAICPSAPIDDARAVALWTTRGQDLVFVRHDGSEITAHTFTPEVQNAVVAVHKSKSRILAVVSESWKAQRSELVLFDTRGQKLDSLVVERTLENAFLNDDGIVMAGAWEPDGSELTQVTLEWKNHQLVEVAHGWTPLGPAEDGAFAMRSGVDTTFTYGFLSPASLSIKPVITSEGEPVYLTTGKLVTIDALKENVMVESPSDTTFVPIASLVGGFGSKVRIEQTRDEGFVSIVPELGWDQTVPRDVVVVNIVDKTARLVHGPADPGDAMAMYCDSARAGYVASDGSVLFSKIDSTGLRVLRYPASGGEPEPVGKTLTQIALLNVAERAGGFVVLGSDGTDTYCGSPDQWPVPASPGAVAGNSVYGGRIGRDDLPLRQLDFNGTWSEHGIDSTGSCVLGADGFDQNSTTIRYRVDDLANGSAFEYAGSDRTVSFID